MRRADKEEDPGMPPASRRVKRNKAGQLPHKPPSPIRDALLNELGRREMTRYQLWKRAREHCKTLSESAVYEFLRGQRAISIHYCEAMLKAMDMGVKPLRTSA
jgi:hypothetical protein